MTAKYLLTPLLCTLLTAVLAKDTTSAATPDTTTTGKDKPKLQQKVYNLTPISAYPPVLPN